MSTLCSDRQLGAGAVWAVVAVAILSMPQTRLGTPFIWAMTLEQGRTKFQMAIAGCAHIEHLLATVRLFWGIPRGWTYLCYSIQCE